MFTRILPGLNQSGVILLIKTNGYKLVLPSGGPSGKYTKY